MAAPKFFADVLWDTSVLPNRIVVTDPLTGQKTTYDKKAPGGLPLAASYPNGVDSRGASPGSIGQMVESINQNISYYCYNGATFTPYPYDCLTNAYDNGSSIVTYPGLIPSRYITMGPGEGAGSADKLQVNGIGVVNATYESTDIRTPPDYLPSV